MRSIIQSNRSGRTCSRAINQSDFIACAFYGGTEDFSQSLFPSASEQPDRLYSGLLQFLADLVLVHSEVGPYIDSVRKVNVRIFRMDNILNLNSLICRTPIYGVTR
ncbi:hypothetical protein D3C81_1538780 [compost metagenome]